jgi:predicted permease
MSVLKFTFVLIIILVFASQFLLTESVAETGEAQTASALANAEKSMAAAYEAASKAAESGANVSSLLVRLNESGWFLDRAQLAYKSGDFDSTVKFATQSQEELNGFAADANALKEAAIQESYSDFLIDVVGPIVGAIGVVCVSFFVWFLMKREYEKDGK